MDFIDRGTRRRLFHHHASTRSRTRRSGGTQRR